MLLASSASPPLAHSDSALELGQLDPVRRPHFGSARVALACSGLTRSLLPKALPADRRFPLKGI